MPHTRCLMPDDQMVWENISKGDRSWTIESWAPLRIGLSLVDGSSANSMKFVWRDQVGWISCGTQIQASGGTARLVNAKIVGRANRSTQISARECRNLYQSLFAGEISDTLDVFIII